MQDHDRALIVGQTSFGKGLVQSIIPLEFGAGLLTSAKYYTPSGRLIQRDYSNGGFYDYYTHGAGVGREPVAPAKPPVRRRRLIRVEQFMAAAESHLTRLSVRAQ